MARNYPGVHGDVMARIEQYFPEPRRVSVLDLGAGEGSMSARLHEAGVSGGIVLFRKLTPLNPLRFLHERVMAICDEEGLFCLDLDPVFAAIPEPHSMWANPLDPHPGPEAHRLAAEEILERFGPVWEAAANTDPATTEEP